MIGLITRAGPMFFFGRAKLIVPFLSSAVFPFLSHCGLVLWGWGVRTDALLIALCILYYISILYWLCCTVYYTDCAVQYTILAVLYSILYWLCCTVYYTGCAVQYTLLAVLYSIL